MCSEEYPEKCPNCGPMRPIENTEVKEGDPDRARKTLPSCLYIDKSSKHGLGVFAKERLELGVYFGPYEGVRKEVGDPDLDPDYAFKVNTSIYYFCRKYSLNKAVHQTIHTAGNKLKSNFETTDNEIEMTHQYHCNFIITARVRSTTGR